LGGVCAGRLERAITLKNPEYVTVGHAVKGSVRQDLLYLLSLVWRATLKGMNDRHRYLTLAPVAGYGLAAHLFRRREVQDVFDNLKRHAKIVAILAKSLFLLRCGAAEDRPQPHAD